MNQEDESSYILNTAENLFDRCGKNEKYFWHIFRLVKKNRILFYTIYTEIKMFSFNTYDRVTSSLILTTILDVQSSRDLYFLKTDNFIVNDRISYLGKARAKIALRILPCYLIGREHFTCPLINQRTLHLFWSQTRIRHRRRPNQQIRKSL